MTQRPGPRDGSRHPNWKGGRILIGGYWYIYTPDHPYATKLHRVAEHRLVIEKQLGRYLESYEVVHHIDGNPQNNIPSNLMLFPSNANHLKAELRGKCPKWTPDGFARMAKAHPEWKSIHPPSKSGDGPLPQTIDHLTL
jgi:hypothetical protein